MWRMSGDFFSCDETQISDARIRQWIESSKSESEFYWSISVYPGLF